MEPAVRMSTDADNILTIELDVPGKPVNTCTPQLLAELSAVVNSLAKWNPAGVIIASAKARSFNAGADLFAIRDMDAAHAGKYLGDGQALFERIARLPMPTVAAINGDCLGGGCELALACTYRVIADDGSISIGLPEVKLGLIPAWRGATRLPRMIGLTKALPILLAGETMPPLKAKQSGLVDEVVHRDTLRATAKRWVMSGRRPQRPRLGQRLCAALPPLRNRILGVARRRTVDRTFGNYPAPLRLLDVVKTGYEHGEAAGLAAEREALLQLTQMPATQNLLRLFFLRQGAKRRAADSLKAKPSQINDAAVIGGGTMGAGIAHALIRAGIRVRLVEVSPAALGPVRKLLDEDVAAGRLDELGGRNAFNRISPTTEWTGLELADLVVEAVDETIDAKCEVFARLEKHTRPTAVLATTTSTLRVAEIANAVSERGRVIGLHFFNPMNETPLVEIIRAPESDDAALASGVALATRMGKMPILVADAPGFLVNRLLIPHLLEAQAMAAEGVPVLRIDGAMQRWGMERGPFELLDEIGMDMARCVPRSLPNSFGTESGSPSEDDIQWRLVLPMVNEAARVLSEGITDSADDIDLATVLGLGFAAFRGGVARFTEDVGADLTVRRLGELATRHGQRFAPAELLLDMARDHRLFPRPRTLRQEVAIRPEGPVAQS